MELQEDVTRSYCNTIAIQVVLALITNVLFGNDGVGHLDPRMRHACCCCTRVRELVACYVGDNLKGSL